MSTCITLSDNIGSLKDLYSRHNPKIKIRVSVNRTANRIPKSNNRKFLFSQNYSFNLAENKKAKFAASFFFFNREKRES